MDITSLYDNNVYIIFDSSSSLWRRCLATSSSSSTHALSSQFETVVAAGGGLVCRCSIDVLSSPAFDAAVKSGDLLSLKQWPSGGLPADRLPVVPPTAKAVLFRPAAETENGTGEPQRRFWSLLQASRATAEGRSDGAEVAALATDSKRIMSLILKVQVRAGM